MTAFGHDSSKSCESAIDMDARLVQEVRRHPALYDPRRRGYKDSAEMDKSWLQIGNELGMRPLDAKNRWRCLRDKFVREKKRLVLDGEASYRSRDPWPLLDEMSFLWDFINHRKDVYTRNMSAKVREEYMQRSLQPILPRPSPEWVSVAFETPEASPSHAIHSLTNNELLDSTGIVMNPETLRIKRDPSERDDDCTDDGPPTSRLRTLLEQGPHQDESSEDVPCFNTNNESLPSRKNSCDEDELFCLSVAGTLRRLNSQKKALAKLRIQQVLYDVEILHKVPTNATTERS